MKPLVRLALWVAALALAGCSALDNATRIDYRSAAKLPNLEVPPDLVSPRSDDRFAIPSRGQPQTLSGFQSARPERTAEGPRVLPAADGVRVERAGNRRWLSVNLPPERVYPLVREFWQESGFIIQSEMPEVGILETDWAENRAKLSQDFIRNTLGKVFDSLYSTGERDKFRTRLERNANGGTEIFVTHRGMVEVYSTTEKDQTVWQPRPADPELETEFLRRMMVKLGVAENEAKALSASAPVATSAKVATVNNVPVVQFNDNFDRAWRRVGLSLDRTGFTVEDRNRSEGTYFVRYVEPLQQTEKPGFISRMFGASTPEAKPERYRVVVRSNDNSTTVSVLNAQGQPDASPSAQRIVKVLADDLR